MLPSLRGAVLFFSFRPLKRDLLPDLYATPFLFNHPILHTDRCVGVPLLFTSAAFKGPFFLPQMSLHVGFVPTP